MNTLRMLLRDIEKLEKISFSSYTEPLIALKDVKKMVEKYLSDDDLWIACNNYLPEEGEEVWVTTKENDVKRGMYTKHFSSEHKEGFICSDGFMHINIVLYWMPYIIPKPCKSSDEFVDIDNEDTNKNKIKEIDTPNNEKYRNLVKKKIEEEFLEKAKLKRKL